MISEPPPAFHGTRPSLLILDVDGVLTTNVVFLNGRHEELKPFFVPDGAGIRLLLDEGVHVAWLSGRRSEAVAERAKELGVTRVISGASEKREPVLSWMAEVGVAPRDTVYVGDDLIDLAAMKVVGLPVAVADAHPVVRERAVAVTSRRGGEGAVREVCEWILGARGAWPGVLERFGR